jgi:hypothetical protein
MCGHDLLSMGHFTKFNMRYSKLNLSKLQVACQHSELRTDILYKNETRVYYNMSFNKSKMKIKYDELGQLREFKYHILEV